MTASRPVPATQGDARHFAGEYGRLAAELVVRSRNIVATERRAVRGAAVVVAFPYADLPAVAPDRMRLLAAVARTVVMLAGLRCLSIVLAMVTAGSYLGDIGRRMPGDATMGVQTRRDPARPPTMWITIASTAAVRALAVAGCALVRQAFAPLNTEVST